MSKTSWKIIGKVKEAHGLRGELYILIFSGEASWATKLKNFQLGDKTFAVERAKAFKKGLIIKPKEISDRTQAEALHGQSFSISTDLLVSEKGETIFLNEILNFLVFDGEKELGPITGFSTNTAQDLLQVETTRGLVAIPFVEAFINKIDHTKKTVQMILPEGLLESQWDSE